MKVERVVIKMLWHKLRFRPWYQPEVRRCINQGEDVVHVIRFCMIKIITIKQKRLIHLKYIEV